MQRKIERLHVTLIMGLLLAEVKATLKCLLLPFPLQQPAAAAYRVVSSKTLAFNKSLVTSHPLPQLRRRFQSNQEAKKSVLLFPPPALSITRLNSHNTNIYYMLLSFVGAYFLNRYWCVMTTIRELWLYCYNTTVLHRCPCIHPIVNTLT